MCLIITKNDLKSRLAVQETWVWSLGWEDPLEKGIATHSSILAWEIPLTEEPGGLQSMGWKESDTTQWFNNNKNDLSIDLQIMPDFNTHHLGSL